MPAFDYHATLMSLPAIFSMTVDTIPAPIPYVSPDAARVEHWRGALAGGGTFKIGIAWQGSATYARDRFRSIALRHFAPLGRVPGVRLISLQMGAGREQLAPLADSMPIDDLGERLGDFYETAAIVKSLDLIVTCDSAAGHLAGALGVPTWIALPATPDWRWMLNRDDSPWYPSVRLFRQRQPGDWEDVFQRMEQALAARV
jgi:hypothetical protein